MRLNAIALLETNWAFFGTMLERSLSHLVLFYKHRVTLESRHPMIAHGSCWGTSKKGVENEYNADIEISRP